jgi:membrane associated rhomboid family serine protease
MLPLGDENPTRLRPIVTWVLIASCVAVFLWQSSSGSSFFIYTLLQYGIIPVRVLGGRGLYTFITNIFLHGGWSHLLGNMLFLWIFGDNIEDHIACRSNSMLLGRLSYLGFYLVCGITASTVWLLTAVDSAQPAVGASGAIAGVLGAYFVFYPKRRIRTLVGLGFFVRIINVRAYTMIGLWFVYQFLMALSPWDTGVAFWAHVGGFVMGVLMATLIRPHPRVVQTYYALDLDEWR